MVATVIIAGLAIWQAVKIWNYSELFAVQRARAEASNGFFGRLLQCPFCLSNWVAAFVVCTIAASEILPIFDLNVLSILAAVPAKVFASARVANLCNDFFKIWDRTPRYSAVLNDDGEFVAQRDESNIETHVKPTEL